MSFLGGLFPGDLGITQTVNALTYAVRFVIANHPEVRARAERIIASCFERDEQCEVEKIFKWVLAHYRYVPDPTFLEHIKSPEIIDAEIGMFGMFQGDCDDVSGYLAALLVSIGFRVQFVVISRPGQGDQFRHIYPRVYMRSKQQWVALEATARTKPMGWEAPAGRSRTYDIN